MLKEQFAKELKKLTPAKEDFINLGYSFELANNRLKEYECIFKGEDFKRYTNDELLDLLTFYDCSGLQIGIISFAKEIKENADYYLIGEAEADILALSKVTLEVIVLDHENTDWPIWTCAANGEHFLDAILHTASFFSSRIKNPKLVSNISYTYSNVLQCTDKAGGEKYLDFYKVLLGYDE